ncbi:MAG TPA: ABC transporter ATP-binding protein [Anaeromyxobacter sp.]|nr:ABC transporter ATP-binding protein [Anaeromyxobacter sp.]
MAEVRLEGVTKLYGRKKAVDDVSVTCREGEFLSIFGPTGAGKSTILKMIAGIEDVTRGVIRFNGRVVNDLPPQERNVSMAFESYNLYPHMNVYENVAFPLRAPRWGLKLDRAEEQRRVQEIADFLGIGQLLERLPQHLSGGQKQRVSLARALVRRPEVYLLDEPIAHLDARLKFSTQTLLKEFASKYGSTIIYVTHDYREALALSHRIVVLRRGAIEQEGTSEEVFHTPKTDFVGRLIGEPPMNLIDGEAGSRDGEGWFQVGDRFGLAIRGQRAEAMRACSRDEGGRSIARLGIRPENIRVSRTRPGPAAFELPVYAVVQETQSTVITFELPETFCYVRTRQEIGAADYRVGEPLWIDLDPEKIFFFPKTVALSSKA